MEPKGTALVTGGSAGIGAAIAQSLAADGWRVAVNYRADEEAAAAVVEGITAAGGEAAAMQADISKRENVQDLFHRVEARFGDVGYLVNNAGVTRDGFLAFLTDEQWDEVMDTNLRGAHLCSQAALGNLMRNGGAISNTVQPSGARGGPLRGAGHRGVPGGNSDADVGQIYSQGGGEAAGGDSAGAIRAGGRS